MVRTTLLVGLMVMLTATPAVAQEPVGCATATIEWVNESPQPTAIVTDEGVSATVVGHYIWVQYLSDGTTDSLTNVVSQLIPVGTETITACTTIHDVTEPDITTANVTTVEQPAEVVTVVAPPEDFVIVEEWVSKNGFRII